ncbi:hypothetical protein NM688_g4208 [Phlebia brevispora]|uniref:Uncharacterized protein n=1 Tax=Phlebia brevispora TaxID=194682 RepID=A0ACC1T3Q2_9APHY|nr:hypothetical protein NM688_g4208 [Phlebia brevispora]
MLARRHAAAREAVEDDSDSDEHHYEPTTHHIELIFLKRHDMVDLRPFSRATWSLVRDARRVPCPSLSLRLHRQLLLARLPSPPTSSLRLYSLTVTLLNPLSFPKPNKPCKDTRILCLTAATSYTRLLSPVDHPSPLTTTISTTLSLSLQLEDSGSRNPKILTLGLPRITSTTTI